MQDFTFHNPTKLVFGKSAMNKIGENVREYGQKVMITYGGGSIKKNGIYEKVLSELKDFDVKEFGGIEPNPRIETLQKAIDIAREFEPDLILAVGGGSVLDGTKLIASATYYDGPAWDIVESKKSPEKFIPVAVVLTMSATGSEMNPTAVITNWAQHKKDYFELPEMFPKFSILDPQNLYSLPKEQTAYGVIDTFSHVLEQYMNTTLSAPLQDRFAEAILLTLIENASKALAKNDDYEARANLMFSATMALNTLIAVGVAQDWATHMIEHEISAFYDIPHAAGLAIITPNWMKVVASVQKREKMVQYGKRVWNLTGSEDEIVEKAIDSTAKFFESLGVKMHLKEWEIDDKNFETIVDRLVKRGIGEKKLSHDEIQKILEFCL